MVTHPGFSYIHFDYDIAVLILTEAIDIDDVITKIIPLPKLNMDVPDGSTGLVTGWGSITVSCTSWLHEIFTDMADIYPHILFSIL